MFELCVIFVCLAINAILAGSETAFVAMNKLTLRALARQGDEKARQLLEMRENPERTLSIIQIGITFVGAFAAAVGGAGAEQEITPWLEGRYGLGETLAELLAILLVVVPLTYASVVLGELVPKTLALRRPLAIAKVTAPWLRWTSRLVSPLVAVFEWSTKKMIELFPKHHTAADDSETHVVVLEDMLSPLNKQYIMNMVKIERTTVKDIMLAWHEVVTVDYNNSMAEVEAVLITSGHTRLPIVRGDNVIGILNSKEFLAFQKTGESAWQSLCRQPVMVQEPVLILTALRLLQEKRAHMAIVYHGTVKAGIVTMEAIFEEVVGDIYDEDDDGAIGKILSSTRHQF